MQRGRAPRSFRLVIALAVVAGAPGLAAAQPKHAGAMAPPAVAPPQLPAPPSPTPLAATPALAATPVGVPTRVSFGPAGPGTGSVTVRGDGMQVSFDGRPIGGTPLTITDVPKGDYVVEGAGANGKQVSRPVTIDEGAEATVDLSAGTITTGTPEAPVVDEGHPRLLMAAKVMLGVSAAAFVVGAVFGVLELKQHSDYESAAMPTQAKLDDMARAGQRDALITNVGFVTCGVALIAAGALALPSFLRTEHPEQPTTTAFISTGGARGGAMAGLSMRF